MSGIHFGLKIGDTFTHTFTLKDKDPLFNFSGTTVEFRVREPRTRAVIIELIPTVDTSTLGQAYFELDINHTITATYTEGLYNYGLKVYYPDGDVYTEVEGTFRITNVA